ncbi:hypothetical protein PHYBOEH_009604 [Phytophthora boehmeriae]|uniref:RxLR effector protein n=1 Tax=Phytophthora boehmeriae TaxID=109152 RepID=A0A8T1X1S1_9STRA|nr:hypothetical protein PHYBOEH_009604 [Phytophthora boehmeriae]
MRFSNYSLAIAVAFFLVCSNMLSAATDTSKNIALKMRSPQLSRSLRAAQAEVDKVKGRQRSLKTTAKLTDEIGNGEEERGLSFSSLKNIFKSSASKKAAAAAKQAQRDQLVAKLAEDGNYRIDMFNTWIKQTYKPDKMFTDYNAVANKNALSVFHSYNQHLKDLRVVF